MVYSQPSSNFRTHGIKTHPYLSLPNPKTSLHCSSSHLQPIQSHPTPPVGPDVGWFPCRQCGRHRTSVPTSPVLRAPPDPRARTRRERVPPCDHAQADGRSVEIKGVSHGVLNGSMVSSIVVSKHETSRICHHSGLRLVHDSQIASPQDT